VADGFQKERLRAGEAGRPLAGESPPKVPRPARDRAPVFVDATKPDEMAEIHRRADLRFRSLERECRGMLRTATLSKATVSVHSCFTKMLIEGAPSSGSAAILLVTDNRGDALHAGEIVQAGDVLVYGPGALHTSHGGPRESINLLLPVAALREQIEALSGQAGPPLDGRRIQLRLPARAARKMRSVLESPWAQGLEDADGPADRVSIDAAERALIDETCSLLSVGWGSASEPSMLLAARKALLEQARAFIEAGCDRHLSLTTLCRELHVNGETLRQVFREFLGMPPMRYVKLHRMHVCRAMLMNADPGGEDNVKSIAFRCGITTSLGRFAREYRATFGELPSQTLAANDSSR